MFSMKHLAPFSTFANGATAVTVIAIIAFAAGNLALHKGPAVGLPDAVFVSAPVFFGSTIYSFEGAGSVLAIHNSMKEPQNFDSILLQVIVVIITAVMCNILYMMYATYIYNIYLCIDTDYNDCI